MLVQHVGFIYFHGQVHRFRAVGSFSIKLSVGLMTSTCKIYDLIFCVASISVVCLYSSVIFYQSLYSSSLVPVVLYNSVAGSLLCQVMYSLLLLPLGTIQPLLSHLLALLEHLNDFNRLLPDTGLLEEQELQMEVQKTCSGQQKF